jgi:hypothetical protein
MNLTLLWKEIVALRFWALFIVVISLLGLAEPAFTEFPDMRLFDPEEYQSQPIEIIIWVLIIGMGLGSAAIGHDREQGTLSFLDALPVSRLSLFVHKWLSAVLVGLLLPVWELGVTLFMGWLSLDSVSAPLPWSYAFGMGGLMALLTTVCVSLGMMLSHLGRWFVAGAGMLVWAVIWVRLHGGVAAEWLDTQGLMSPGIEGNRIVSVSWRLAASHAGAGVIATLIAAIFYMSREGRWSVMLGRMERNRLVALLLKLAPLAAVLVIIGVVATMAEDAEDKHDPEPVAEAAGEVDVKAKDSTGFGTRQTPHYEFLFLESDREKSQALMNGAESAFKECSAAFGDPAWEGERMVVDLAAKVMQHAGAQTNWTKIRLPLDRMPKEQWRSVLRHETAHVFIGLLSGGRDVRHFNELRCFHEGMASYVETYAGKDAAKERQALEQWAALAWSRGAVPLSLLSSDDAMSQQRDEFLVYPLGMVLARAIISVGGKDMPRLLLETLRDRREENAKQGLEFWRDLLGECGCSLEQVDAEYHRLAQDLVKQHTRFIAPLPRITAKAEIRGSDIVIDPQLPTTVVPAKLVCFVDRASGLMREREQLPMSKDGLFHLPVSRHARSSLRFMVGWRTKGNITALEKWQETVLQ